MKTQYLARRRSHLFVTHGGPSGIIPPALTGKPTLRFGHIERSPASGNENEAYIEVLNPSWLHVDVSGWTISGDVRYTFRPGAVVPANGTVFVAASVNGFRSRATSPKGGKGLFIQGDYDGRLSDMESPLVLRTGTGVVVDAIGFTVADAASALQLAAGLTDATPNSVGALDLESAGDSAAVVDIADALRILRLIAGLG